VSTNAVGQLFFTKERAMRNLEGCWYGVTHARRRGWHAAVALMAIGIVACSGDSSGPPAPGSILVTTETSGFLKAEGYEVVVDGVGTKTIGANDEVTVAGLDPGTYYVDLGDVPDNCGAEGVLVSVESEKTAEVSLTVGCAYATPVAYSIQFSRERPDLDTGEITVCAFGICPTQEAWDLYVHSNSQTEPRSVIRQNQTIGVEIAHLPGVTLAGLTEADFEAATFTTELVGDPFGSGRVILIRTDLGNVYALGNAVEDLTTSRLTFSAALIAKP
jgi:hypothetical protein